MDNYQIDEKGLEALSQGRAPQDGAVLERFTVGLPFLTDFLTKHYLEEYIPEGGSKVKFVTGRQGAGKSHLLGLLEEEAKKKGFITVRFSAHEVWLHDFKEFYLAILNKVDFEQVLKGCASSIMRDMGEDPSQLLEGQNFLDLLSDKGKADALSKNSIRDALRDRFIKNPILDNNFAQACSLLTGDILGYPTLETGYKEILNGFLFDDRTIKFTQFRQVGLAPTRLSKFNARNMLRSLCEVIHQAGYPGLAIFVDDVEVLCQKGSEGIHYTKMKRDDAYESIRQLIDDIDTLSYFFLTYAFDEELMESTRTGIKSYQALWIRIQNEIEGSHFNRFADIIDLEAYANQQYTPEVLVEMSEKLCEVLKERYVSCQSLTLEKATSLRDMARYGSYGLPRLVVQAVLEEGRNHG